MLKKKLIKQKLSDQSKYLADQKIETLKSLN